MALPSSRTSSALQNTRRAGGLVSYPPPRRASFTGVEASLFGLRPGIYPETASQRRLQGRWRLWVSVGLRPRACIAFRMTACCVRHNAGYSRFLTAFTISSAGSSLCTISKPSFSLTCCMARFCTRMSAVMRLSPSSRPICTSRRRSSVPIPSR